MIACGCFGAAAMTILHFDNGHMKKKKFFCPWAILRAYFGSTQPYEIE